MPGGNIDWIASSNLGVQPTINATVKKSYEMARVLVLQHVAAEPLGLLDPMLRIRGHRIRYVNFARDPEATPRLERYQALIVLGGPMQVAQQRRR